MPKSNALLVATTVLEALAGLASRIGSSFVSPSQLVLLLMFTAFEGISDGDVTTVRSSPGGRERLPPSR